VYNSLVAVLKNPLFYWSMMALLLITPFVAHDIKGSRSWISLGPVSLQPAEFAKCATALMVSKVIGQYGFTLNRRSNFLRAAGIVFLPLALIVLQKETGSALVYFAFFLMFYREGMPGSILFCGAAAVVYFVVGIGQGETVLPGTLASVGETVVLALVWLFTAGVLRGLVLGWTPLRLRLAVDRSLLLHVRQRPLPWWGRGLGHSSTSALLGRRRIPQSSQCWGTPQSTSTLTGRPPR